MWPKWVLFATLVATAMAFPAPYAWTLVLAGIVIHVPVEYVLHRFYLHANAGTNERLKARLHQLHIAHHEDPADPDFLFNFPSVSILTTAFFFAIYLLASRSLGAAAALTAGQFAAFLYYEYAHWAAHHDPNPRLPWVRAMKRHHLLHHFKNEHYWFGVTQPAMDVVVGTNPKSETIEKSPTVRTLDAPPDF